MSTTDRIESYKLAYTSDLYISDCAQCGVAFGIPTSMERRRRDDGNLFYCPNGHALNFGAGKSERLEGQLERERRLRQSAEEEASYQDYRARAFKGQLTKVNKRIGKGVCPCCNRHFVDVERHMASQHPELTKETP
jgi:hypothetical protein